MIEELKEIIFGYKSKIPSTTTQQEAQEAEPNELDGLVNPEIEENYSTHVPNEPDGLVVGYNKAEIENFLKEMEINGGMEYVEIDGDSIKIQGGEVSRLVENPETGEKYLVVPTMYGDVLFRNDGTILGKDKNEFGKDGYWAGAEGHYMFFKGFVTDPKTGEAYMVRHGDIYKKNGKLLEGVIWHNDIEGLVRDLKTEALYLLAKEEADTNDNPRKHVNVLYDKKGHIVKKFDENYDDIVGLLVDSETEKPYLVVKEDGEYKLI